MSDGDDDQRAIREWERRRAEDWQKWQREHPLAAFTHSYNINWAALIILGALAFPVAWCSLH